MFRVGLVSRWHLHAQKPDERYTRELLRQPDCRIVCVWDKNAEAAAQWAEELHADAEPSLESLLSRNDVDGIVVTSETSEHKDIMISAAKHGKHIFTEKTLSFHTSEALEIKKAIEENGVQFSISFPNITKKKFAYAKKLVQDGTIGEPVMFRILCGHNLGLTGVLPDYWFDPDICGGGAMMDLGCHPYYLARYLFGEPKSVSSSFTYYMKRQVEDNASCNILFENGVMGTIESTFTSPLLSVYELSVYGTKGAYYCRLNGNTVDLAVSGQPLRQIAEADLPETGTSPIRTWIDSCTKGTPNNEYNIDCAVSLVKFMEAAYRSHDENGRRISVQ